jgi:hypothetical protein
MPWDTSGHWCLALRSASGYCTQALKVYLNWMVCRCGRVASGAKNIVYDAASFARQRGKTSTWPTLFSPRNFRIVDQGWRRSGKASETIWTGCTRRIFTPLSSVRKPAARQKSHSVFHSFWSPIVDKRHLGQTSYRGYHSSPERLTSDRSDFAIFSCPNSQVGAINTFLLIIIAICLLFGHISMTKWLLTDSENGWQLLDDEMNSPLYCLSGDDLHLDLKPPKIRGPRPDFDDDGYYPCLPKRLDHAAPGRQDSPWPEALCLLATRLELVDPGDDRCA